MDEGRLRFHGGEYRDPNEGGQGAIFNGKPKTIEIHQPEPTGNQHAAEADNRYKIHPPPTNKIIDAVGEREDEGDE